ncbi:PAS domain S-box protein [Bdellovibrio sp. NC01]|uniref:PAS domain S-box protein n=1 Tax=Bdellovibrio sp. NC01 TaxID=2220073 RepID=UPI001159ABB7|nr:PAS domain S-box protein [Bdellovibrio sp. NC01]QDK38006.1 hypothetical protein DOE51_10610 [Bdellovibrio sp. NC01]
MKRYMFGPKKHFVKDVLAVVISVGVAFAIRAIFSEAFHEGLPFIFFLLAIMFCGWFGGFWPGFAATVASTLLSHYFFLSPVHSWKMANDEGQLIQLAIFFLAGVLISLGCERFRKEVRLKNISDLNSMRLLKRSESNEDLLNNIIDALPSLIASVSADGRYEMVNQSYADWYGRDRYDIVGKRWIDVIPADRYEQNRSYFEQAFAGVGASFDTQVLDTQGMRRVFHSTLIPMGKPLERVLFVSQEITDRIQALETVKKSEMEFRTIFELAGSGKFEFDTSDTHFLRVNRKFCEITGYSKEELLQMRFFDLAPEEEREARYQEYLEILNKPSSDNASEKTYIRKDGKTVWLAITSAFIRDPSGKSIRAIATTQDITYKKKFEFELMEANRRTEEANRAKSAFLANMSHEIRTPLGAMLGFAQLLSEAENLDPDQRKQVLTVLRNGEHLYRLVNELLDISKIEANKMEIERIEFDLEEVLRDVTSLFALKAQEKGLAFEVRSETPLPLRVVSDPTKMRQVVSNIIGNAIKFTERGDVIIRCGMVGDFLFVRVDDTGPGISTENQATLFQPFAQGDVATTRKHGGTGLGLYLSKKMAHALGGDVVLERCDEGKGCTFALSFRLEIPDRSRVFHIDAGTEAHVAKGQAKKTVYDRVDGARVLVVDDVEDNLQLAKLFLSASGAVVECALDARACFELLKQYQFDIVLLDIQMPKIDGYEAVKIIREQGYKVPVIALTAHTMLGERERCLEAGFDGYLGKPINRTALIQTVKAFSQRTSQSS